MWEANAEQESLEARQIRRKASSPFADKPCKRGTGMSSCQRKQGAWGRGTKQFPDLWCTIRIFDRAIRITWDTVDPFLLSLSRLKKFLGATCVSGIQILNTQKVKGAQACHGYCDWEKCCGIAWRNVLVAMESKICLLISAERIDLRVLPLFIWGGWGWRLHIYKMEINDTSCLTNCLSYHRYKNWKLLRDRLWWKNIYSLWHNGDF